MLTEFPLDKINVTKKVLLVLLRVPTQSLLELKHMVHLSKTVGGIFHFLFRIDFIKLYIFVQKKVSTLWL